MVLYCYSIRIAPEPWLRALEGARMNRLKQFLLGLATVIAFAFTVSAIIDPVTTFYNPMSVLRTIGVFVGYLLGLAFVLFAAGMFLVFCIAGWYSSNAQGVAESATDPTRNGGFGG